MKKVILIQPLSPSSAATGKEELIGCLKSTSYSLWLDRLQRKFGPLSDLHKVLPINAATVSLGLLSLCTYLKQRGLQVDYLNCDHLMSGGKLTITDLAEAVANQAAAADVCGLYSTTPMICSALNIAQAVKRRNPATIVVLGGPHVTFTDRETIDQHHFVDYVVRGEGEETLYEIAANPQCRPGSAIEIPGTTYRCGMAAKRAPERPLISAAEIPSPGFEFIPTGYKPLLITMYSRGCPFACRFCAEGEVWKRQIRFRDPRTVAKELRQIRENLGQNLIHLADSEIDVAPPKLHSLVDAIAAERVDCRYTVNLRPDAWKRLSPAVLRKMVNLGFIGFFIGVESGSDRMLARMNRRSVYSDFLKTLDLLNQFDGLIIIPYLMLGFPGETAETLQETQDKFIDLLAAGRISFLFPKIFIPYPGTDPYKHPELYGITLSTEWEDYCRFGFIPPFTSGLDNQTLGASVVKFYERINATLQRLM